MFGVERKQKKNEKVRIEPVDNWHHAWPMVLAHIQRRGSVRKLMIDLDGWLSARQVAIAAFVENEVAAHICFGVVPLKGFVEARVVSYGLEPAHSGKSIESILRDAALQRAKQLNCARTRGFKLADSWS